MAKPKRSSGSGLRKSHGPKRHMFSEYKPMVYSLSQCGVLTKYSNRDSFNQAVMARSPKMKSVPDRLWNEFLSLKTNQAKNAWFDNLANRDLLKEEAAFSSKKSNKKELAA